MTYSVLFGQDCLWNTGIFSLRHHRVQAGSGVYPAYQVSTRGSFPEGKAARAPLPNTSSWRGS
jgi:hypothetical protein